VVGDLLDVCFEVEENTIECFICGIRLCLDLPSREGISELQFLQEGHKLNLSYPNLFCNAKEAVNLKNYIQFVKNRRWWHAVVRHLAWLSWDNARLIRNQVVLPKISDTREGLARGRWDVVLIELGRSNGSQIIHPPVNNCSLLTLKPLLVL